MDVTLYRYRVDGANWSRESTDEISLSVLVQAMMELPFQGEDEERQYGFAHCGVLNGVVYGLYVQKFPKVLTDYDKDTKQEIKQDSVDSGEYLFVCRLKEYEIHLQNKRSSDLADKVEILKRFSALLKMAMNATKFMFSSLTEAQDEVDRDRVVKIFYEEADTILEMDFADFDISLIEEEKQKRGGAIQKYFNPIEEYQPAMQEAAIRMATNAEKTSVKAKKGGNLKKDPITRAMLEVSRKPMKIVYIKEENEYTDSAVTKRKEVISIEGGDLDLSDAQQVQDIFTKLLAQQGEPRAIAETKQKNKSQKTLFDNSSSE